MKRAFATLVATILLACPLALGTEAAGPAMDLDGMIGQMLMIGFRGTQITPNSPIARDIETLGLGGVILFDRDTLLNSRERNIQSPDQVRRLTADLQRRSRIPLLIAVDQEGGRISRLKPDRGFPDTFSAAHLGAKGDPGLTASAAEGIGRTMRELGLNLDFAPDLDVNANPDNPVIGRLERSFSSSPEAVATHGLAFIDGLTAAGVLPCAKHFPGHGSSNEDSHKGFTNVTATWNREELAPFKAAIDSGRLPMIMTGHLYNATIDPTRPATLSAPTITGLLRETLGFNGVVVTDDLQMRAVTDRYGLKQAVQYAIEAGADILLFGNNLAYDPEVAQKAAAIIKELVRRGKIPPSRIVSSYDRIISLKRCLARMPAEGK